jgi:hypothetical protein
VSRRSVVQLWSSICQIVQFWSKSGTFHESDEVYKLFRINKCFSSNTGRDAKSPSPPAAKFPSLRIFVILESYRTVEVCYVGTQ